MTCSSLELRAIFANSKVASIYQPGDIGDGNMAMDTIFKNTLIHTTWYSLNHTSFNATTSQDNEGNMVVTYDIPNGYHYLLKTHLDTLSNFISVKKQHSDRYRIRLCNNPLVQMIVSATLKLDDIDLQILTNRWLNWGPEFLLKEGYVKKYRNDIGNIPALQTFSQALPSTKLSMVQPWSYSRTTYSAFPIFNLNSQSKLNHVYVFNLNIDNIIQMEELGEDEKWNKIIPDLSILNGIPHNGLFQIPVMYGELGFIEEMEINQYKDKVYHMFTDTSVDLISKEPSGCSSNTPIEVILDKPGLYKAVFWGLHNRSGITYNIHNNYTTSLEDTINGNSPVDYTSITYANANRAKFTKIGGNLTSGTFLHGKFPRYPDQNGINAYSFCSNMRNIYTNVCIDLCKLGACISVKITDPETTKWSNAKNGKGEALDNIKICEHKFDLVAVAIMQKYYTIDNGKITDMFSSD